MIAIVVYPWLTHNWCFLSSDTLTQAEKQRIIEEEEEEEEAAERDRQEEQRLSVEAVAQVRCSPYIRITFYQCIWIIDLFYIGTVFKSSKKNTERIMTVINTNTQQIIGNTNTNVTVDINSSRQ